MFFFVKLRSQILYYESLTFACTYQTNRAIGSVRIRRCTDLSEVPQCDCSPSDPCGPNSGCVNRSLLYECLSSVCVHGKACRNQFFTQRQYPKQAIFYTGKERGWGLKTLVEIQKVSDQLITFISWVVFPNCLFFRVTLLTSTSVI